jgi:hypothetical protein
MFLGLGKLWKKFLKLMKLRPTFAIGSFSGSEVPPEEPRRVHKEESGMDHVQIGRARVR